MVLINEVKSANASIQGNKLNAQEQNTRKKRKKSKLPCLTVAPTSCHSYPRQKRTLCEVFKKDVSLQKCNSVDDIEQPSTSSSVEISQASSSHASTIAPWGNPSWGRFRHPKPSDSFQLPDKYEIGSSVTVAHHSTTAVNTTRPVVLEQPVVVRLNGKRGIHQREVGLGLRVNDAYSDSSLLVFPKDLKKRRPLHRSSIADELQWLLPGGWSRDDDLSEYRESFDMFDHDGDGYISAKELNMALRTFGIDAYCNMRQIMKDSLFPDDFITDEQDVIPRMGFQAFCHVVKQMIAQKDPLEELERAFFLMADKEAHMITKASLKKVARELDEDTSEEELEMMIALADRSKSGGLTLIDFYHMMRKTAAYKCQTRD